MARYRKDMAINDRVDMLVRKLLRIGDPRRRTNDTRRAVRSAFEAALRQIPDAANGANAKRPIA